MWAKQKQSVKNKDQRGFTIVELLIVIVVIGILAAITIVAYNSVQGKARDQRRLSDASQIRKSLELYRADKGDYPNALNSGMPDANPAVPGSGWESSTYGTATWLDRLKPYTAKDVPLDPANDTDHFYYYYFYKNNAGICGASTPNCYVLGVAKLDNTNALQIPGVDTNGADPWRNSSATRAVWRGSY